MAFKGLTDHVLLEKCQSGQIAAYEEIFMRYAERLYDFALRYVSDTSVAEELMMDVLLWLWQNRNQLAGVKSLSAYLFTAVRNRTFSHLRVNALKTISLDTLPTTDALIERDYADQSIELAEIREQYIRSLAQLSPKCRAVFVMSREEQLSYHEIATKLEISVKTVEGHVSSALKFLRKNLAGYSDAAYLLLLAFLLK